MGAGFSLMLKRAGVYYHRKAVPQKLRALVGKRELLVSLRTKDKETAKGRLHAAALDADRQLAAARAKHKLLTLDPTRVAEKWKRELLQEDAEARSLLQPKTKAMLDAELEDLEELMAETQSYLTFGNIEDIQWSFVVVLERYGVTLAPESPEFRQTAHALLRAGMEAAQILRRRAGKGKLTAAR